MYNPDGQTWGSLIGQYPKPGSVAQQSVTSIIFNEPGVKSMTQPLMLRSNDGYIHIFIGMSHATDDPNYSPGTIRYFRSAEPEAISQLVDRTELIPRVAPYNEFHLRMNASISRDGERAAIVILAISKDGSVPFNTPVIFQADKQGPDFVFRNPVNYAEPMGFFYPQIALTDSGTVIVGQLWDDPDRSITRLLQLDGAGKITYREDLPATTDGNYWCCDLRPIAHDNWNTLVLYYNKYPKDKQDCRHEFWTYTPATNTLTMRRSISVPEGQINYGKWIPVSAQRSFFIHNPSMGTYEAYDGNLLDSGEPTQPPSNSDQHTLLTPSTPPATSLTSFGSFKSPFSLISNQSIDSFSPILTIPLPATNPTTYGYAGTAYTFVPNPLQGSLITQGASWFATDCIPQKNDPNERTRAALLLYRLNFP